MGKILTDTLRLALAALLLAGLSACVVVPADYETAPHYHHGPVVWYDYWYYPHVGIYFDVHRSLYFYYVDGRWVSTRILPRHYHGRLGDRIKLRLKDKRPYVRHREHVKKYPGRKYSPPARPRSHPQGKPPGHPGRGQDKPGPPGKKKQDHRRPY